MLIGGMAEWDSLGENRWKDIRLSSFYSIFVNKN